MGCLFSSESIEDIKLLKRKPIKREKYVCSYDKEHNAYIYKWELRDERLPDIF